MVIFLKIVSYIISCIIINLLMPRIMSYLVGENYDFIGDATDVIDNIYNNESEKPLLLTVTRVSLKVMLVALKGVINSDLNVGIKIVLCLLCIYIIPCLIMTSITMDILIMFLLLI